jgi:O-antigen/teichoic acid export membrane protein
MGESTRANWGKLVVHGITWCTMYHIFQSVVSFLVMIFLVRIIPPTEYGRVSAMLGFLTFLNSFNSSVFMSQALQLPDGVEPDWSLHWSAGFYIHIVLGGACQALAGICWLFSAYRPIAPVLHLAGVGLLLDWPNQLRLVMLRRTMAFRRMQILFSVATFASLAVTLALGLAGGGAYAIVVGSNVISGLPFTIDLLVISRWRPQPGWWRWPDWTAYRPALCFGLQHAGSGLLYGARGILEAAVLPGVLGFAAIGLLNRAQALFSITIGRMGSILVETVYPILPRYAADPLYYSRQATLFVQFILLIIFPSAIYLGLEGCALSRIVYGETWAAADPLIWPGAMISLGLVILWMGGSVVLAVNQLRAYVALNVATAALGVSMVVVAWAGGGLIAYAWAVAVGQLLTGGIALTIASPLLAQGWLRAALAPPIVCSFFAAGTVLALDSLVVGSPLVIRLSVSSVSYAIVILLTLCWIFPTSFAAVLRRLPEHTRVQGWLRLLSPSGEFS